MKQLVMAGAVLALALTGNALAACPGGTSKITNFGQLKQLIEGNTICARSGSDKWQEFHSGNQLVDWKKGPTDPTDRTEVVGSYSFDNRDQTLTHTYGTTSYRYDVCSSNGTTSGTNLTLSGANGNFPFSIRSGQGACPP